MGYDGYQPMSFLEVEGAKEVAIEFHSLSKTFNMTGWRIGMAVGNPDLVEGLAQAKSNLDSGIFQAIQEAGIAALKLGDKIVEPSRKIYQERRDILVNGLRAVGLECEKPRATFYVWVSTPKGLSKWFKFQRMTGVAMMVAALGAALVVSIAAAQAPPNPPSRFVGAVTVNGAPAPAGTLIEARIGNAACGQSSVFMSGSEARYALDSPALDPAGSPGCGADGSTVQFFVGGQKANETGSWANYRLNTVNLTVAPAAAPSPTPAKTPAAPVAGNAPDSGGTSLPLIEFMLVAAALGLAGVGVAARVRAQ